MTTTALNTKDAQNAQGKISGFVSASRTNPQKIVDGAWMLREAIAEEAERAARHLTIAAQCAEIGDDTALVYHLRCAAALMRFAGAVAGDLKSAKEALRAPGSKR